MGVLKKGHPSPSSSAHATGLRYNYWTKRCCSCNQLIAIDGLSEPTKSARGIIAYDTNLDEPAQLLRQEAVEVEEETAAEDSGSVERPDAEDASPPAFEE